MRCEVFTNKCFEPWTDLRTVVEVFRLLLMVFNCFDPNLDPNFDGHPVINLIYQFIPYVIAWDRKINRRLQIGSAHNLK